MKLLLCNVLVATLAGAAASSVQAQTQSLQLTMKDGRVTIVARDVPLRALLDEWSRVGQTLIVNADKLTGSRVTLQLDDTPERAALDILLRSAAGYIAAPRPESRPGRSAYDRITILATSSPPAAAASASLRTPFPNPAAAPIPSPAEANDDNGESAGIESQDSAEQVPEQQPAVAPVSPAPSGIGMGQPVPSRYKRPTRGGV